MKLGNTFIFNFRFRANDLSHALVVYNNSTPIKRMRFTPVRPILSNSNVQDILSNQFKHACKLCVCPNKSMRRPHLATA